MEETVLAKFTYDVSAISEAVVKNGELRKEIILLRGEQNKANEDLKNKVITDDQHNRLLSVQDAKLSSLRKTYTDNKKVITASTAGQVDLNNALTGTIKSEAQAINNISKLTAARKGLDVTTDSGKARLTELNAAIDKNNKFVTENSDKYTQQKRNVGNYTESIKEALQGQNLFNGSLSGFTSVVSVFAPVLTKIKTDVQALAVDFTASTAATEGMTVAQRAQTVATAAGSGALKLFKIALISTGVGALVVALGSLVTFLSSTQKGIDIVTSVTRPLQAVFGSLVGVSQKLGEALFDTFSNPKQAAMDLVNFLVDNVINRFKAFGVILEGIQTGDFGMIADGILQAGTGVEDLTSKIAGAASQTSDFLADAAAKGAEMDALIKSREKLESTIASRQANLNKQLDEQRVILSDTARSGAERAKAADEAESLQRDIIANENEILDLNISQLKIKQSLNDTSREEDKQLDELIAKKTENAAAEDKQKKQNIAARKALGDDARKAAEAELAAIKTKRDAVISASKEALDLFIQENSEKGKTLAESLKLEQDISNKRLEILAKEFEAGNISKVKYETEKLKIEESFLDEQSKLAVSFAKQELDEFLFLNQGRLDANQRLTDELVSQEITRLELIAEQRRQFEATRLAEGEISKLQFDMAVAAIDAETYAKELELNATRKEEQRASDLLDVELDREIRLLQGEEEFVIKQEQLDRDRLQDLSNKELTESQKAAISGKYDLKDLALTNQSQLAKVTANQKALGQISALAQSAFGESKELSIAIALADTYLSVQKAYLSQLAIPSPDAPVRANIAAIQAGIFGAINVAKIAGISFYEGGQVPEVSGRITAAQNVPTQKGGDNVLALVTRGEVVLNKAQQQRAGGSEFFRSIGVKGFATGGQVGMAGSVSSVVGQSIVSNIMSPEQVMQAIDLRIMRLQVVNQASDTYRVANAELRVQNEAIR